MHHYHPNIWIPRFRNDFIPAIRRVEAVFLERIQPTFCSIDAESEKLESQLWEELTARPYYENDPDEGQIAEFVRETAATHYLGLKGMEQGLLNCCALFLYHLYEQHLMMFLRQELLDGRKKNDKIIYTHKEVQKQLNIANVELKKFKSWPKLEELKHLANAIKHGQGKSSVELQKVAPHFFESASPDNTWPIIGHVNAPLLGEDIRVLPSHIREYSNVLEQFWRELGDALHKNLNASFS